MKINTATLNHPRVIKLKRRLGADAVLSLIALWAWAESERPDGILTGMDEEDLAIVAGWTGDDCFFITTLIELRLLDWNGEAFALADLHRAGNGQPAPEPSHDARSEQARNAARARWENKKSVASMLSDAEHESAYAPHDAQHMRRINQHDPHVLRSSSTSSCTTTTPNPSSFTPPTAPETGCTVNGSGGGGDEESGKSGTAGEWEYPASLTPYERQQAETLMQSQSQAQALLDELAAAIQAGKIKTSPIAYLRALAKRAHEGAFKPEAGIKIALARARRRETESAVRNAHAKAEQVRPEATARPPIDKDAVKTHIAALRAAMRMPGQVTA
ncbi:MAG: hypothetical protein P9F19_01365 [Candidatus Contendobacter sp.]|nr:hypothetical protein [Candidatus Contendobacter sp.]MDG4556038.1 hypothetical protein [Candidatus Contendobacter sp.]